MNRTKLSTTEFTTNPRTRKPAPKPVERKLYRISLVLTEITYVGESPEEGDILDGDVLEESEVPGQFEFTDETLAREKFEALGRKASK